MLGNPRRVDIGHEVGAFFDLSETWGWDNVLPCVIGFLIFLIRIFPDMANYWGCLTDTFDCLLISVYLSRSLSLLVILVIEI